MLTKQQIKKKNRIKDYTKKKNMLRNNVKKIIVKGRALIAGAGLTPKSRK
jgi:hypothetical protein